MADRFNLSPITAPASPADTTTQIVNLRASAQAALNTIDEENNLLSYYLHGVGRADGCVLTKDIAGVLRLPNGWFLAGPGVASGDAQYFPGARLIHVNAVAGYIELTGANAPPASGTWYGHMSAYGDVTWFNAPQIGSDGKRPGGRWLIGQVVTDASGAATAVDATLADILGQKVSSGSGEEGGEGDPVDVPEYVEELKWSVLDPRPFMIVFLGIIADLEAKIAKLGGSADPFPAPFDRLADEIAINRSGLAEVNPHSIERGQISIVAANAGHSQDSTPDFTPDSPDADDPLQLPWDATTGLFGP
ncbi:hypothetical protein IAD21_00543 [Abditibacteriota bacterium]|nr:hypothetical protein IAD21_00543 [Abditibacteriota bacterium]